MPTEMIHALYDGGGGAGLEDYWNAIASSPFGGGGFIWVLADEGIMRTDQGNRIDVFSTYAPDGIVGPKHEKKGSYYTVRDVFSPVQIDRPVMDAAFTGKVTVHNRYDFTDLSKRWFYWRLLRFPDPSAADTKAEVVSVGKAQVGTLPAGEKALLDLELPAGDLKKADVLEVTFSGSDRTGHSWTWATHALADRLAVKAVDSGNTAKTEGSGTITLQSGKLTASFDSETGMLKTLTRGDRTSSLSNGPRFVSARPQGGDIHWIEGRTENAGNPGEPLVWKPEAPALLNLLEVDLDYRQNINWAGFKLEITPDGQKWKTLYDATRRSGDGKGYEFPPQMVAAVRLSDLRQVDGGIPPVKGIRAAYQAERFPVPATAKV
ncbi:MAG: beta-galactosidase, partial [Verrucomicrobiaceae bacterium]